MPLLSLCACGPSVEPADIVLTNAFVYTVDANRSTAEAVAIRENKIVFVEANAQHRFHSISEDLTTLVFFAPAES
jgi:predicted amidohydrolase YtcJ